MRLRPHKASEKQEQAAIVQLLEKLGAKVYVIGTKRRKGDYQGTMQTPGIPDLYVVLNFFGKPKPFKAIWIEVKARGGKLSDAQRQFKAETDALEPAMYHIVGGVDDVQNWLVDHGWLKQSQRRSA